MELIRCILIVITVVVILIVGLVEVCLLSLVLPYGVIKSDNYTEGDTDLKQFNPVYCKDVEMKLSGSNQSTASLLLLNTRPPLSWRDILEAALDDTLQPDNYFSNWSFHIHPGSEMTVNIEFCLAKSDPICTPTLRYEVWFRIIRGEKNFSQWRRNQGNPNYAVKSFKLTPFNDCHIPLTLQYHYEEEGDYYHIVKNSGNCAISINANITINRTQYDDEGKRVGKCRVPNRHSSYKCSVAVETTNSQYYALLVVDQASTVTKWKNDIHVALVCVHRAWIAGVGIGTAGIGFLTIVIMCGSCCLMCLRHRNRNNGYENIQLRPRRGTGSGEDEL